MWEFSQQKGSRLQLGRVVKAVTTDDDTHSIIGVQLEDGTTIKADKLVVACGPWTEEARSWFPSTIAELPEVTGVKCHSILVKSIDRVLNQAVFFESDGALGDGDLEVYPRPDGDCYVNGFEGQEVIVTERPGQEQIEPEAVELLENAMRQTSSELGGLKPHTQQVCYWPETPDGLPLIGAIPGVPGAFVATGHSVWGILQSPATGMAMAELLLDGESKCLDLGRFQVDRFPDDDF
jgi:glycine/D-amino acid oxidase-like deaminating enzyme